MGLHEPEGSEGMPDRQVAFEIVVQWAEKHGTCNAFFLFEYLFFTFILYIRIFFYNLLFISPNHFPFSWTKCELKMKHLQHSYVYIEIFPSFSFFLWEFIILKFDHFVFSNIEKNERVAFCLKMSFYRRIISLLIIYNLSHFTHIGVSFRFNEKEAYKTTRKSFAEEKSKLPSVAPFPLNFPKNQFPWKIANLSQSRQPAQQHFPNELLSRDVSICD